MVASLAPGDVITPSLRKPLLRMESSGLREIVCGRCHGHWHSGRSDAFECTGSPDFGRERPQGARRFYEEKLGFEVEAQVAETVRYRCGNGTGLAIFERPMTPMDRTVAAFEVADIETEVGDLRSRGVEVEGIITLGSGVRRAFFKDPDGNIIGMRQI